MKKYKLKLDVYQLGFLIAILNQAIEELDEGHGAPIADEILAEVHKITNKFYG